METTADIEAFLEDKGLKPTPNRVIVARELMRATRPMSLLELDYKILTMDRSSIFRVLRAFADQLMLHEIDDGSGSIKYEMCHGHGHCSPDDTHVHFYCEQCHRTFCLEEIRIPRVELPEGFSARYYNFVAKGICPECGRHGL